MPDTPGFYSRGGSGELRGPGARRLHQPPLGWDAGPLRRRAADGRVHGQREHADG